MLKKDSFFILSPPPNVTGSLHIGHSLTFAIQNYITRSQAVTENKESFLALGFDHGGLSTTYVAKQIHDKPSFEQIKVIAEDNKIKIAKQFKLLNLFAKSEYEEYTMNDFHYQFVQNSFIKFFNQGFIFKKKSIVSYDIKLQTVLSDMEIENHTTESKLYKLNYKINDNEYLEVQTTRPETIFSDVALCVHPDDDRYQHLIGKKAQIPIYEKWIPIIADSEVKIDFGSGVLKITPAHSPTDFKIGEKYSLPIINTINYEGKLCFKELDGLTEKMKIYENKSCEEVRSLMDFPYTKIKNQIPYGNKSKSPIEYIVKEQWFFDISSGVEKAINNPLNIQPSVWHSNYLTWLKNIQPLWCISRQIVWGHRIPVWYKGSQMKVCIESPGEEWTQETDVLDTWFSSALWPLMYKEKHGLYPCDVLVTAYDIIFFWVARMVIVSLMYENTMPFKSVFIHDLVRDSKGQKMSKTHGNVIDPVSIIETHNSDLLSLSLLLQVAPNAHIHFSETSIQSAKCISTKLKNAVHFLLTNKPYKTEMNKSTIENHFLYLLQKQQQNYSQYLNNLQIHLAISSSIDFLYTICDYLLEFSKIYEDLLYVLQICIKACIRMLYGAIPKTCTDLWQKLDNTNILSTNYTKLENYSNIQEIHNLIYIIEKIRKFMHFNINIHESNEYTILVSKFCGVKISKNWNCKILNYKILIQNIDFINDEIFKIDKKLSEIELFFQKCDTSKVPENILNDKKQKQTELQTEKQSLVHILDNIKNI